ncbi:MAG: GH1 family beta-glucosidase [Anaerolineae bacterium]|nr:GH1 family beta-glucosidase [Anaerolineae bacterium]
MTQPLFPPDFYWGVATSSYQIEGAITAGNRGESIWDRFTAAPRTVKDGSTGAVACDHYHRYEEDVALMKWLGVNAYRFSVAWPRVIPGGRGAVNGAGLDFYERLVDALLSAGIAPFITLYHWDLPQALQDNGGWTNRDTPFAFADYAAAVLARLGDRVRFWMTHNEPWVAAFLGNYFGLHAPGWRDLNATLQAAHHMLLSHGLVVPLIKAAGGQAGFVPNLVPAQPATPDPADLAATQRHDEYTNRWFLDPLAGRGYPQGMWETYGAAVPHVTAGDMEIIAAPIDFLGINYYNRRIAADNPGGKIPNVRSVEDPSRPRTLDREIYPEGLYDILVRLHREYPFPALYVTENGAAMAEEVVDGEVHDPQRLAFLRDHFAQATRAIAAGVPLHGYFVWSLLDNFEWAEGYTLRYGIIRVDYDTLTRTPKKSAAWYRDYIASHRPARGGNR